MSNFKKISLAVLAFAAILIPAIASAQFGEDPRLSNVQTLVLSIDRIVGFLVPIVFTLGLVAFFWGLAVYIFTAASDEGKTRGRRIMVGGIIALFIMASIWGIVSFIGQALDIGSEGSQTVPGVVNPNP